MEKPNISFELEGLEGIGPDLEFEVEILKKNTLEANLLIKKGYKIKKSVWNGLIAS